MRLDRSLKTFVLSLALCASAITACGDEGDGAAPEVADDEDYGKALFGIDQSASGKADGFEGAAGPKTAGLTAATAAWKVTRQWADKDDASGLAWGEKSGLTWDQKYAKWVESLPKIEGSWGDTVEITTPWGKKLPAPHLECAEVALFLRFTFASWHNLPFYLTAWSSATGNMYFGHFGVVNANGAKISGYPSFGNDYKDFTAQFAGKSNEFIVANWPKDTNLRARRLSSRGDDDNSDFMGGKDQGAGAYLDEIYLNKRAAQLLMRVLVNFGSIHLASTQNTFNLKPEAIREGDMLLERWQKSGIGHTVVTKDVLALAGGKLSIETMFGSMPRIQPTIYDSELSRGYFTSEYTGGEGVNGDGQKYAALGGGLKRWRIPITKNGRWYMSVPTSDQAVFIDASDLVAIAARPAKFDVLMGELPPAEARDALLQRIQIAREGLHNLPASCSKREAREAAFDDLYELMSDKFDMTPAEVDAKYRILDDYVLPEMIYNQSKTCCWNSTTSDMYLIIMQMNQERVNNVAAGQCQMPIPFYNKNGGYQEFADYAASIGMAAKWKAWSEDETCTQKNVTNDTEAPHDWAPFCSIRQDVLDNTDRSE